MRNLSLTVFLLSIAFLSAQAQPRLSKAGDTTHHVTIIYNFLSNTDPLRIIRVGKNDSLKHYADSQVTNKLVWKDVRKIYYGDKVNFRIRLNPFLYDVKVNGVNVFDESKLDTAYQSKLLAFFNNGTLKKSAVDSDTHTIAEPKATNNPVSPTSLVKQGVMITAGAQQNEVKAAKKEATDTKYAEVSQALGKQVPTIKKQPDSIKTWASRLYNEKLVVFRKSLINIDSLIDRYEEEKTILEDVLVRSFADYMEYDTLVRQINQYLQYRVPPNPPDTIPMTIEKYGQSTSFVQRFYAQKILPQIEGLDSIYSSLKNLNHLFEINTFESDSLLYVRHKNKAADFSSEKVNEFAMAYTAFLQNLNNPQLFEKSYSPNFVAADSFRFRISLSPSARAQGLIDRYKIPVRDTNMDAFTVPVKRYLKLNLSTGLSFLFGGAVPHAYFFSTPKDQLLKDSDVIYIRKGEHTAVLVPRVALYTHLYLTNGDWSMPALTFGISTNPADPSETAYMLGASWIMGNHKRFVLTAGTALANIDQIKARYKDIVDKPQLKLFFKNIEEAGLVERRLALGMFFGLSYNF